MLSYQHIYHAGNLADVHKHALLAWMLDYLTRKDKPVTYIETHAGRGLYDLDDPAARKTGEAAEGIEKVGTWFDADHPLSRALRSVRSAHGPRCYPGSPLIAAELLRPTDAVHFAELHPQEHSALSAALARTSAKCYRQDGFALAHALTPPTPRRGLMLIDPSYEIKTDYTEIPRHIAKIVRAWNVGTICLWYPILARAAHEQMVAQLETAHPAALRHEVRFPPARPGHGMVGSGLFVIMPPYGLSDEAARLAALFRSLMPA
ncbi:23S rRNA (adenine(2030)-N(6))-methyltransferase RlmJ [Roseobacter sinensis]|uniref:Ribosomal RNA large subunit methyltransferase J n=1 Tax=Roseobacter sinensis TaxID=2931391 RepID=A0ABT3BA15_9RHOB|nr:23S rRNA (adenine(2030)-N(6))-methyltransferase RlmJ [Roseobacter sp. WL0113]MCV3270409.1 23S rRNA (adenine(2030)-N(6))-methyltransferase RlmJ [Roseobacter sp. WL0113]